MRSPLVWSGRTGIFPLLLPHYIMSVHRLPSWTNQRVSLYHGTLSVHARAIVASGVNVSLGTADTDFGPGFYTTTLRRQAESWAWSLVQQHRGSKGAVVQFDIDRDHLAQLETISFVRGDFDATDFWSLVTHCRTGGVQHARGGPAAAYDVAIGPVAAFWRQRSAMSGADQVSFHTAAAQAVLNASPQRSWTL